MLVKAKGDPLILHAPIPNRRNYKYLCIINKEEQLLASSADLIGLAIDGRKRLLNTTIAQPPQAHSRRRPQVGPCIFGHAQTSARDNRRRPRWNAVPSPSPWEGIRLGKAICQRCYEFMLRHSGTAVRIPLPPDANIDGNDVSDDDVKDQADQSIEEPVRLCGRSAILGEDQNANKNGSLRRYVYRPSNSLPKCQA